MAIFLAIGCPIAVNRAMHSAGTDYVMFCDNGRYIVEHGVRNPTSNLARYWPSVDVLWIAMAYVPIAVGMTIWYALNVGSWYGLLRTIREQMLGDATPSDRKLATLAGGLIAMPLAIDGMCLGSFHVFMVWFMVAGLLRVRAGKEWSGGVLLGLAVWMKLLPLLGVGYLIIKRKWRPAIVAVGCALAIDVVLSVAAFGFSGAWQEHVTWWNRGASGTVARQLTTVRNTDEDRITNQSLVITVRRVLSSFGRAPHEGPSPVQVASLSGENLTLVYYGISGCLALSIAWFCRRSAAMTSISQSNSEIALFALATLWFSPVVWSYHPTAATPALALVLCRMTGASRVTWTIATVWMLGIALLAWTPARAAGDLLWLSVMVGGVLVWTNRAENCPQPCTV